MPAVADTAPPARTPPRHPVLGPGFSGGAGSWLVAFVVFALAAILGLAFTLTDPPKVAGALLLLGFAVYFTWATLKYPVASLALVILAQVLIPVYVRLPIPGLPSLPPALVLLLAMVVLSAITRMIKPVPMVPSPQEKMLSIALLIYGLVLLLSIPNTYASFGSYAMFVKTVLVPALLYFTVLAKVRTDAQLNVVFHVLLVAAVACGALAIDEYLTGDNIVATYLAPKVTAEQDYFLWYLVDERKLEILPRATVYRVFSFFTQPLEYAAFMTMVFPFSALSLVMAKSLKSKVIYAVATVIIFVGFAVSFSRGPTLALALVMLVLAIYEKRVRPWILAGTAAILVGLIAVWPILAEKLTNRLTGSKNVTLRFRLWENGLDTFIEHPLRGIGYGSYPNYHVTSIREHMIGPMYEYPWRHIERVTTMENIYVTLAAETGILGLAALALYLTVFFHTFRKVYTNARDDRSKLLALSSMAGVLAFLLSGMTVANNVGYTISTLYFGVFIAAIAILSRALPARGSKG